MNKHKGRAVRDVVAVVCDEYGITSDDIYRQDRHRTVSEARAVAYTLCREQLRMSYPELGEAFERDHTTILAGVQSLARKVKGDEWLAKTYAVCRNRVIEDRAARRVA